MCEVTYTREELQTYQGDRIPHPTDTWIKAKWLYWDEKGKHYGRYKACRVVADSEEEIDLILRLVKEQIPESCIAIKQHVTMDDKFDRKPLDEPYWEAAVEYDDAPSLPSDETFYQDKYTLTLHTVRTCC